MEELKAHPDWKFSPLLDSGESQDHEGVGSGLAAGARGQSIVLQTQGQFNISMGPSSISKG